MRWKTLILSRMTAYWSPESYYTLDFRFSKRRLLTLHCYKKNGIWVPRIWIRDTFKWSRDYYLNRWGQEEYDKVNWRYG